GSGRRLQTKPPLAPEGTMTAFLTSCAFTSPRTSVRKSSSRSDQRSPPRATRPKRRCTASSLGEYTKISNFGRGSVSPGTRPGSSLSTSALGGATPPDPPAPGGTHPPRPPLGGTHPPGPPRGPPRRT